MAKMTIKGLDEYAIKLSRLSAGTEETAKRAIYEGASVVADQMRANLRGVLSSDATGDLDASLGITPVKQDADGNYNVKIGFDGYGRDGTPNQLKARVLESGSSKQKKRPFVRPAVNATRKRAQEAINRVIDDEIKKLMK